MVWFLVDMGVVMWEMVFCAGVLFGVVWLWVVVLVWLWVENDEGKLSEESESLAEWVGNEEIECAYVDYDIRSNYDISTNGMIKWEKWGFIMASLLWVRGGYYDNMLGGSGYCDSMVVVGE